MEPRARVATAATLLGVGFAAQQVSREAPGIGFLIVAFVGVALVFAVAKPNSAGTGLFAMALLFTALLALRASLVLQFFNLCAAVGLAVLAASYSQEGNPFAATVRTWIYRWAGVFSAVPDGIRYLSPPKPAEASLGGSLRLARAALVSGGLLLVFGTVLASADAVFAHTITAPFDWGIDLDSMPRTVGLTLIATVGAATLLAYAAGRSTHAGEEPAALRIPLGGVEWAIGLASVALLFAMFVAFQFGYLFGGEREIAVPGMTYAEYARSGFFQMMLATILTLLLVGSAWIAWARQAPRGSRRVRTFNRLATTLLLLNLVVLASAFKRLTLYEGAYGWTQLRFAVHAIILWLAVFLLISLLAILAGHTARLTVAASGLSVLALLAINAINPDAFIAERNLDRYAATGKLDLHYLSLLSADATPVLVEGLDELPGRQSKALGGSLACRATGDEAPWYAWNLGTARGRAAVEDAGLNPPTGEGGLACSYGSYP